MLGAAQLEMSAGEITPIFFNMSSSLSTVSMAKRIGLLSLKIGFALLLICKDDFAFVHTPSSPVKKNFGASASFSFLKSQYSYRPILLTDGINWFLMNKSKNCN